MEEDVERIDYDYLLHMHKMAKINGHDGFSEVMETGKEFEDAGLTPAYMMKTLGPNSFVFGITSEEALENKLH